MEISDRKVVLPGWVVPAAAMVGFAWGVNRLRRGDSNPLTWGVTALSLPVAVNAVARMTNRRQRREDHDDAPGRSLVAAAVGSALTGLMGAMAAR